jgi:hypothetical protein
MESMALLLADNRGVYIPRDFVNEFDMTRFEGVVEDDVKYLKEGPNHDWYWEAWESLLDKVTYTEGSHTWRLHQDGDLWLVCAELMDNEEYQNFFGEMKPAPDNSYEFEVCSDCLIVLANDDDSGIEDENEAQNVRNSLDRTFKGFDHVVPDGAGYGFMWSDCECCGALPGDRYRVIAWNDEKEVANELAA